MSQQGPHFSPHSKAETNQISGRMVSSGTSDVSVHFSLLVENSSEEVDDYDNYYNNNQKTIY